jgi:protein TonB
MFQNLIESGSHRKDLARRGRFLLGTLALYSALVATAGVASVFAYNARLDAQNYEITMLPSWTPPAQTHTVAQNNPPAGARAHTAVIPERTQLISDLNTTPRTPPTISTQYNPIPPIPPGVGVRLGKNNTPYDAGGVGPVGPIGNNSAPGATLSTTHIVVATVDPPPPAAVRPTPAPTPPPVLRISQVLNSRAVNKPVPAYPPIAIAARQEGTVTVEILIDEQGRVVNATAKEGPLMLREAARQAAMLARFTPTKLNGEPVKVSGVISYNFTLR